ncbi:hypothetical protein BC827DRAFT_162465 [Russula dissimulans]|nr:hypothetical protein BC827DRAFT_162465 [Russula dissimulans]
MSNFPSHTPQRIAGTLLSVIQATQQLLNSDPSSLTELRSTYLQFYSYPIFTLVLGIPTHQPTTTPPPQQQLQKQLDSIVNSIQSLSKTVDSLAKNQGTPHPTPHSSPKLPTNAAPLGKGQATPNSHSYAAKASAPARPSLIINFDSKTFKDTPRPQPTEICLKLNKKFAGSPYDDIRFAAAKWTSKGNLVLTGRHTITQQQLKSHFAGIFDVWELATIRANVKCSRILLNGVPTGKSDTRVPFSSEQCHNTLTIENPYYASLMITQKPAWVREPSQFNTNSSSSLAFSFEDPDGTIAEGLIANRYLFAFGAQATIKKWKTNPQAAKANPPSTSTPAPPQPEEQDLQPDTGAQPTRPVTNLQEPPTATSTPTNRQQRSRKQADPGKTGKK